MKKIHIFSVLAVLHMMTACGGGGDSTGQEVVSTQGPGQEADSSGTAKKYLGTWLAATCQRNDPSGSYRTRFEITGDPASNTFTADSAHFEYFSNDCSGTGTITSWPWSRDVYNIVGTVTVNGKRLDKVNWEHLAPGYSAGRSLMYADGNKIASMHYSDSTDPDVLPAEFIERVVWTK